MLCRKPLTLGGGVYGCGRCLPCRVNRSNTWAHRILLESKLHKDNSFLTLTYEEKSLPVITGKNTGQNLATLEPRHLRDWLKRFRAAIHPSRIRFFACGEYGEKNSRPHYHVIIFGHRGCRRKQTNVYAVQMQGECCKFCTLVNKTWGHGFAYVGEVNESTINYVAKYVLKKMNGPMAELYDGRYPDFARMSLRPGIGHGFVKHIATTMRDHEYQLRGDVPTVLQHGMKKKPLGVYLRRKLRQELGRDEKAPMEAQIENSERLLPLRLVARSSSKSVGQLHAEETAQQALNMETRLKIRKTREKI